MLPLPAFSFFCSQARPYFYSAQEHWRLLLTKTSHWSSCASLHRFTNTETISRQWKYLQALKNGLLDNSQTMGHLGNQNKNATPTYFCLLLLLIAKSIYYTFFAMAKLLPKNHYCDKFCWSMDIEFSPGGENLLGKRERERERVVWMIFFTPHWLLLMHREKQVKSSNIKLEKLFTSYV